MYDIRSKRPVYSFYANDTNTPVSSLTFEPPQVMMRYFLTSAVIFLFVYLFCSGHKKHHIAIKDPQKQLHYHQIK